MNAMARDPAASSYKEAENPGKDRSSERRELSIQWYHESTK